MGALEADSDKLQNKYPGPNAEHIAEQLEIVQSNWDGLQDKAKFQRQMLVGNLEFQKYLLKCQDLLSWCSHLKIMLLSDENLKIEIESKETNFMELMESSKIMKQRGFPFSD